MKTCPETTVRAWVNLVRVEQKLLADVEAELKAAGCPSLAWYDALLELSRAPGGRMRPVDLERAMLLPQYSTSRLVDRLVKAGLAIRQVCPIDGRGQFIEISGEGRRLQKRLWPFYAEAIQRHLGARLSREEIARLGSLLGKLV
ncbi:MAG: winged helix-turn-helix transcriptional regulator [Pseudorhodoplanes sp.]|nr:MAG: winged helix-turn-helix transcriptional regulator [Pseudorhodoplanes sp.]